MMLRTLKNCRLPCVRYLVESLTPLGVPFNLNEHQKNRPPHSIFTHSNFSENIENAARYYLTEKTMVVHLVVCKKV